MKRCSLCNTQKDLSSFGKHSRSKDGLAYSCKDCKKKKDKLYYEANKKKIKDRVVAYHKENPEVGQKARRDWNKRNKKKMRLYRAEWKKRKYNNDSLYKLNCLIRSNCTRLSSLVKQQKELRSLEYLGCTIEEFKTHIESLWLDGMTWENHGDWHIDHKIPLDYFVKNEDDPWKANHYSNLQPLWAEENLRKGNSI